MNDTALLLALTFGAYILGVWIRQKSKISLLHPLSIAVPVIMAVIKVFHIPVNHYMEANKLITFMLGPSVVALALVMYDNLAIIKKYLVPLSAAVITGSVVGVASVYLMGRLFGLDEMFIISIEPKSVTAPIAVELAKAHGGNTGLAATSVVLCGVLGASIGPWLMDKLKIGNPVARGAGMGCSSHGIGTSRAIEEGALQGAVSGLCMAIMGVTTALIMPLFTIS